MCGPPALVLAATAMSAIGTGVSALQANAQAKYEAKISEQNARLSAEAADDAKLAARDEALEHYRRVSALKGQQRVTAAANGVNVEFGTAADVLADTDMLADEDARRIYDRGAEQVRGFDIEGANYRSQANASRTAGKGALIGGAFNVASTALGGAQQFGDLRSRMG